MIIRTLNSSMIIRLLVTIRDPIEKSVSGITGIIYFLVAKTVSKEVTPNNNAAILFTSPLL